ncbi:hypothetical protein O0L34_g10894 [Tuta absoluta]|nr:hypothetical protein O0L34_g10894 [Tuta absoluta]
MCSEKAGFSRAVSKVYRQHSTTTKMQYKMRARPPLDERGKNETEIQIYSRKSELHRARGTLTHKNEKNPRTPTSTTELKKSEWGAIEAAHLNSRVSFWRREAEHTQTNGG